MICCVPITVISYLEKEWVGVTEQRRNFILLAAWKD